MSVRKSSRGNPYHDEYGRFCSANGGVKSYDNQRSHPSRDNGDVTKSEKSPEEYAARTEKRFNGMHYIVNEDGTYGLTSSNDIQEGMIVEYTPEYCGEGEEKYVHVVKEYYEDGFGEKRALISTINTNSALGSSERVSADMIRPAGKDKVDKVNVEMEVRKGIETGSMPFYEDDERTAMKHAVLKEEFKDNIAEARKNEVFELNGTRYSGCERKVDGNGKIFYEARDSKGQLRLISPANYESRTVRMPWMDDPKYSNRKNGQLMWLIDHPDSKYNDTEFLTGIKRIEAFSDRGVSAERRQAVFKSICEANNMTEAEGRYFISPMFLK